MDKKAEFARDAAIATGLVVGGVTCLVTADKGNAGMHAATVPQHKAAEKSAAIRQYWTGMVQEGAGVGLAVTGVLIAVHLLSKAKAILRHE